MYKIDAARESSLQSLESVLGYGFQNIAYLDRALTHRSFGPEHNERLEFLGDAILGLIIGKRLFDMFPQCPEGDLTRMRSSLVRETTLAAMAREFNLGDKLRLGQGELKSGGARRDSLLADAVESIIGAMFLDTHQDYAQVNQVVLTWFASRLAEISPNINQKDAKSQLQELLQAKHLPLPTYTVDKITGADNNQTFFVSAKVVGCRQAFHGSGTSRRRAEQVAAMQALEFLKGVNK